ncbi:hypothetical protein [Streptomyces sp. sk2.1]|uniref:hypothetical protein n=1 Tax=Streptomyces sp. sk2.1 TaxID=2478959 RepID=UPI0011E75128|nr:hypothetical protein [Streptomyces sp. sk2.1]TXS71589.1 hypothetical protein EAO76_21020 [Streptomyces sp. sk2.1]
MGTVGAVGSGVTGSAFMTGTVGTVGAVGSGVTGSAFMTVSGNGSARAAAGPSHCGDGPAPYFFRDRLDST